jgi:hypothetical protein
MQRLLSSCVFILEFGLSFITMATLILLTLLCCLISLCARVVFFGFKIPYCQLFIGEVQLLVIIKSEGVHYASNVRGEVTHTSLFGLKGFIFFIRKFWGSYLYNYVSG